MRAHHITTLFIIILNSSSISQLSCHENIAEQKQQDLFPRRILHEPLIPSTPPPPPPVIESSPLPRPPPPPPPPDQEQPFFPGESNPNKPQQLPPPPPANGVPVSNNSVSREEAQQAKPIKKVAIVISVGIVTLGMLSALAFYLIKHQVNRPREPQKLPGNNEESRIQPSNFLYIGTVEQSNQESADGSPYRQLITAKVSDRYRPSPDLQPLPPLPKPLMINSPPPMSSSDEDSQDSTAFYTPRGLSVGSEEGFYSPIRHHRGNRLQMSRSKRISSSHVHHSKRISPKSHLAASPPNVKHGNDDDEEDGSRPKLKPLHWDKVKASSDKATVWDQLKSSTFQLNEDMMESLFVINPTNSVPKENNKKHGIASGEKEIRLLDPKKSQNIAIFLRALNVSQDEVSEALLEGNQDGLGLELLETLVKMAPTKEEEIKLLNYNDDIKKLGPAERFFKAILDVPFAFTRVEAMLYRKNFDTEVIYLRDSYNTLEEACTELKNSRLFLKLLEAVLRTGNRMNVGTKRGDARAFKLDTLLKLVDIKGTDGKTTLLHFVVQEIIRSEQTTSNPTSIEVKEEVFKKQELQIVSSLGKELSNTKKAAGMDSDVLHGYLTKLKTGLHKVKAVLQYENQSCTGKFFESMKIFVKESEHDIDMIKAEEHKAMLMVREVTDYFHGDAAKEEAHPFRIFMIVRDFLSILDNVCREVGRMQERTIVGSARSFNLFAYQ